MQFIEFKEKLKAFKIFGLTDIRKNDPDFDLRRLNEWQNKNYIRRVRKGWYIFSDLDINEASLFLIANKIYAPSYISLEMGLSQYNLIPEMVYEITCVTSQKTASFKTEVGNFSYRHIKPELMFGYELRRQGDYYYSIAEIEKTLLDYLYLKPKIKENEDFQGMRFNYDEFKERADMKKWEKYLAAFKSKALTARAKKFIKYFNA